MDLSKAFDCLPPALIQDKLAAYWPSKDAVKMINSYLSDLKQCVQVGNSKRTFQKIIKKICPTGIHIGYSLI